MGGPGTGRWRGGDRGPLGGKPELLGLPEGWGRGGGTPDSSFPRETGEQLGGAEGWGCQGGAGVHGHLGALGLGALGSQMLRWGSAGGREEGCGGELRGSGSGDTGKADGGRG